MFLKNYTSDAPVSRTIARIEDVLIRCGVLGIEKEYGPGAVIVAIKFRIELQQGRPMIVRLPVDVDRALDALFQNYAHPDKICPEKDGNHRVNSSLKRKTRFSFRDQAERTAWKITQDWVEVQMSMIQMQQADFREVFLPYLWDGRQTVFTRLRDSGFKALLPETTPQY